MPWNSEDYCEVTDSMEKKKRISLWEAYLTKEIGIEFKACLYFFAILFFYCVYRLINGNNQAGILEMAEMIVSCYIIGYIQVYVFGNFDEADRLGLRECLGVAICTIVYGLISFIANWFERNILITLLFAGYILFTYVCVFLVYRSKRRIDDKRLNENLRLFQTEHKKSES